LLMLTALRWSPDQRRNVETHRMRLHPLFSQERVRVRFTSFTLKTSLRVPLAEYVSGSEISPDRTGKMPVPLQVTPPSPEGGVRTLMTNPVYFIYRPRLRQPGFTIYICLIFIPVAVSAETNSCFWSFGMAFITEITVILMPGSFT
jgi:hypothetical protein